MIDAKTSFLLDHAVAGAGGRGLCSFGGGGGGGGGQTTQETRPVPYSTNIADAAVNSAGAMFLDPSSWAKYYPGQTVAGFTDAQNRALQGTIDQATRGSAVTAPTTNFLTNLESGAYLYSNPAMQALAPFASGQFNDPTSNPAFSGTLTQLTSKTLPGILGKFITSGNMNNPGMMYAAGQGVTDAVAPYLSQLYESGLNRQMQAINQQGGMYSDAMKNMLTGAQLAPMVQQLPYADLEKLYSAGATQQQQAQQAINADMARWNFDQTQRQNMINWLAGLAFGQPMGSVTTGTVPRGPDNTGDQVMKGIGTAASIAGLAMAA